MPRTTPRSESLPLTLDLGTKLRHPTGARAIVITMVAVGVYKEEESYGLEFMARRDKGWFLPTHTSNGHTRDELEEQGWEVDQ